MNKTQSPIIHAWDEKQLRDYFAAAALPMAWESEHHKPTFGNIPLYKGVANRAYLIANAMLAERNK